METGGRALATPGDSPTKAEGNVVPAKAGAGAPETPAAVQVRAAFGPGGAAPSSGSRLLSPRPPPSPFASSPHRMPSRARATQRGPRGGGLTARRGPRARRSERRFGLHSSSEAKANPKPPGPSGRISRAKAPPAASAEGPGAARSEHGSREDPRGPGSESPRPASCARSLSPARCPPHHEFPGACALLCV